jgi:spermidine synthase
LASRQRGPASIEAEVDFGVAELRPDPDHPGGWTLLLDGYPQSYVDAGDPRHLEFEYVRRLASVVDLAAPPGLPLAALHLGGGALTLPRYLATTRPRSTQRVVERDARLTEMVRGALPLPRGADLRVRASDARAAVEATAAGRFDLVVGDVYSGARIPAHLTTAEYAAQVARVLKPGGIYAVNLSDGAPLAFSRGQVATLRGAFSEVCLIAEPGVLRGRRFGNVVLVAALAPDRLPIADLARSATRDPFPARLMSGDDLTRFVAGAKPVTDAAAVESPMPPRSLFA